MNQEERDIKTYNMFMSYSEDKKNNHFTNFVFWLAFTVSTALCYYLNYRPDIMNGLVSLIIDLWFLYMAPTLINLTKFLISRNQIKKTKSENINYKLEN